MYDIYVNGQIYLNEVNNLDAAIKVALTHDESMVINNHTREVMFRQGD